jgi:hypothetical protein
MLLCPRVTNWTWKWYPRTVVTGSTGSIGSRGNLSLGLLRDGSVYELARATKSMVQAVAGYQHIPLLILSSQRRQWRTSWLSCKQLVKHLTGIIFSTYSSKANLSSVVFMRSPEYLPVSIRPGSVRSGKGAYR